MFCQRLKSQKFPLCVCTAPCPPSQLNVSMNCANNSATLTWSISPNALSYTGKATNSEGHTVVCDAGTNLGCQLHGLQCGKEYTFTVSSSAGDCQSSDSEPVVLKTGERVRNVGFHIKFYGNKCFVQVSCPQAVMIKIGLFKTVYYSYRIIALCLNICSSYLLC